MRGGSWRHEPRLQGVYLEEVKAKRGSAGGSWVTPARLERISRMRKSSKSSVDEPSDLAGADVGQSKRQGGQVSSRGGPATGRGKPLKAEAQGRYRHETRSERLQAEQGVKRLRKPEGAAQPGEASPVQVAACFCKRRRVPEPHGRTTCPCNSFASGQGSFGHGFRHEMTSYWSWQR